jgi:sialidase-1
MMNAVPDRAAAVPLSPELQDRCLDTLRRALGAIAESPDSFWPAMHAAEGLTLAGHGREVIALLSGRLPHEADPQRRCGLAREIVRAGDRRPLPLLFETLADRQSAGRVHAAESLYKIAELGDGKLLRAALAEPGDPRLKLMAAAALGRGGNRAALDVPREALRASDHETRKIGVWVIGLLGGAGDVAAVESLAEKETDELTRAFAVHALACLDADRARSALRANLSSKTPAVRAYAAEFSGYSRMVDVRPRLIELLADDTTDVRVRAAQSLVAFSLPRRALGLPLGVDDDVVRIDIDQADEKFRRYSEGSILALRDGALLYAITAFAGGGEDHSGATINGRLSYDGGRTWTAPRVLQKNIGRQNVMSVTLRRLPVPKDSRQFPPLGMFFLIKNSSSDLKVVLRVSDDEAESFGDPIVVTPGPGYHVMNNDRVTILSTGRIVCPVSFATDVFKDGHFVCRCFLSDDAGQTWRAGADQVDQPKRGAMEPEVVELASGRLMMIIRTQRGIIATSLSDDGGDHWAPPEQLPVQAPEAPATIRVIPATGELLLIWNNVFTAGADHDGLRRPLTAAISRDEGRTWEHLHNLETDAEEGYAYTSLLFHKDRAIVSYYVYHRQKNQISSRLRSLPVRWLYGK